MVFKASAFCAHYFTIALMKYFLTLLALVLPLQAIAQIDDFLKSVITTIDTVTTEIVKQGKGLDTYLKKEAAESKSNPTTEASADSETTSKSTNAFTSASSSASSLGSVARSNTNTNTKPSTTVPTTSTATSSTSSKAIVNNAASTEISDANHNGKFENGKVKIHIFEDDRGETVFTSSLCKGQWGIRYFDKGALGSMKVNGMVFTYAPDYSSFELKSLDKYKKCLPNEQYTRIVPLKSASVVKTQTAQVLPASPQPKVAELKAKEVATKDVKTAQQSGCNEGEKTIFSCTIKGKPLNYCYIEQGGMRMITLRANLNGDVIETSAYDLRDSGEKPPYAEVQHKASNSDGRDVHMTVFMEGVEGKTYAITECGGMRCGIYRDQPWFSIFNKGKRVFNELCDEDSLKKNYFDYKYDKKGRIVNDGLFRAIKKKLNVDPPEID